MRQFFCCLKFCQSVFVPEALVVDHYIFLFQTAASEGVKTQDLIYSLVLSVLYQVAISSNEGKFY